MSTSRARPRVVAIWTLLAALIVVIVVVQRKDESAPPAAVNARGLSAEGIAWLLPAPIEQLGAIEVAHAGVVHRLERDSSGAWFYHGAHDANGHAHAHESDPTISPRIERALAGFGRTRIERTFPLDSGAADIDSMQHESPHDARARGYGVDTPSLVVLVYARGSTQPWVQYAVGDVAPDGLSRYVLPVGSTQVVTIANYQITNLLNLIVEVAPAQGYPDQTQANTQ